MTAQIEAVDFFAFDNSYARLPDRFFARLRPTPVAEPRLVRLNKKLAWHLRLDPGKLAAPEGVEILAGNRVPKRGEPLAMAYAGHQFGTFVPQLGDGRAILLGEVIDRDGVRRDIQLKGSGPTPFSRQGDGRAALGPVLREYIVSEAMAALGIPTTRALAAVRTIRDPSCAMVRKALSKSNGGFSTLCERSSMCRDWATRWTVSNCSAEAGSQSAAIGLSSGNASTRSSSCLAANSGARETSPVIFLSGRAMLLT